MVHSTVPTALYAALDLERACDTNEASKILGPSPITLEKWRHTGEGPRWFRCGRRVRYRLGDLIAFRDARMVGKAS